MAAASMLPFLYAQRGSLIKSSLAKTKHPVSRPIWSEMHHVRLIFNKSDLATLQKSSLRIENGLFSHLPFNPILAATLALILFGTPLQCSTSCDVHAAELTTVETTQQVKAKSLPPPKDFPPLHDLSLPAYEKMELPNGLHVFLLEDHELGLVGGQFFVRGGSKSEPAEKLGVSTITSIVQRSGGTIAHPSSILDRKLEAMAASIETSSSVSQMSVAFQCLEEDVSTIFPLFAEVVQEPLIPKAKLELARSQVLGSILRRNDNPDGIASREFRKLLYGTDSVYARVPEKKTVSTIERADVLEFYKKIFQPRGAVLGIWGDFDALEVKALITKEFGTWNVVQGHENESGSLTDFVEAGISKSDAMTYVVDRPGLSQGYVRMGELGTTILDPDIFALDILNGVLNGFGGLLFDEIRSREGLAYSVSGGWSPAVEHRGAFIAGGETQLDLLPNFVRGVKQVLEALIREPPKSELVAQAKEAALNSFIFNFADSGSQLSRIMSYDLFGIDQEFPFKYRTEVEKVTREDVLQAARRHLHPDSQPILIVTDASKLKDLLSNFLVISTSN